MTKGAATMAEEEALRLPLGTRWISLRNHGASAGNVYILGGHHGGNIPTNLFREFKKPKLVQVNPPMIMFGE